MGLESNGFRSDEFRIGWVWNQMGTESDGLGIRWGGVLESDGFGIRWVGVQMG
jgi:hypothetical protein